MAPWVSRAMLGSRLSRREPWTAYTPDARTCLARSVRSAPERSLFDGDAPQDQKAETDDSDWARDARARHESNG